MSSQRQELEESKLRERALRAQIIEYGKTAEDARAQQRRQPQVVEMPNVEHIQQLATATASAVAAREVMKMDPRQLVQDLKDELIGSFSQKVVQLESQSGTSNDATIAAMRASMQRERESTVSEVKHLVQQLQLELQQHYDDNITRISAAAAAREAELVAEANAAKQVAALAAAAAAAAESSAAAALDAAAAAAERKVLPSAVVSAPTDQQQQQYQLISAQSLRDVSSSSAPHSPNSVSSFEGGAAADSDVQISLRQQKEEVHQVTLGPSRASEIAAAAAAAAATALASAASAAASAPLHLSSASEVEDSTDAESSDADSEDVKPSPIESASIAAAAAVVARAAAQAPIPDSPSGSSSAHTSATASPDEIKPARVDAAPATPPGRVVQAKLSIDDVLPLQMLTMPQGYSGSPIASRVLITVDEIQQQLQLVETFLSRKHSKAATSTSALSLTSSSSSAAGVSMRPAAAAGGAARSAAAATTAVLARDAVSELQRRHQQQPTQQQQQPLRVSAQAAPAKLDVGAQQAVHLRSLLLHGAYDDSDSGDEAQSMPVLHSSHHHQHRQRDAEILLPVMRSSQRASSSGGKSGGGALISDSDSDEAVGVGSRAQQLLSHQRDAGVSSSPADAAKASVAMAASRVAAAAGARSAHAPPASSSSGETASESDYEEDFDAESGSGSSRQQPPKVRPFPAFSVI